MPCSAFHPHPPESGCDSEIFFFLLFDISRDYMQQHICIIEKKKRTEKPKNKSEDLSSYGLSQEIMPETPCHQRCLVCSMGRMPGQAAQK